MSADSRVVRRKAWFLLGMAICALLAADPLARRLAAQDAAGEPAAEAADVPPAAPAAAPASDAASEQKSAETKSFLLWVIEVSGFIGFVILLLSIYFVSTVARLFWDMRLEVAAPPEMISQCESLLEQRDFKGIYNAVKDDESFLARILTTGITELPNGLAEAREAMDRMGESLTAEMEKRISMLAVLGTLGPMIGLLGTLKGMIASFSVIAMSDTQLKASQVAGGISEALILTFEGVALSVPAIYFFALFRNRVVHISTSVMLTADQFLRHFSHAGRVKAQAASTPKPST